MSGKKIGFFFHIINKHKKEFGQYSAILTEQAWSNLCIMLWSACLDMATLYMLLLCHGIAVFILAVCIYIDLYIYTGVDPGFFLGRGAPLRNDVTDGEVKNTYRLRRKLPLRAGVGGVCTPGNLPLDPPLCIDHLSASKNSSLIPVLPPIKLLVYNLSQNID